MRDDSDRSASTSTWCSTVPGTSTIICSAPVCTYRRERRAIYSMRGAGPCVADAQSMVPVLVPVLATCSLPVQYQYHQLS